MWVYQKEEAVHQTVIEKPSGRTIGYVSEEFASKGYDKVWEVRNEQAARYPVGYFDPLGNRYVWLNEYETEEEAASRVHYLNGGSSGVII